MVLVIRLENNTFIMKNIQETIFWSGLNSVWLHVRRKKMLDKNNEIITKSTNPSICNMSAKWRLLNADFQEGIYRTKSKIVTRSQKGKWTGVGSLPLITCPKNKVNCHNLTEPYSWSALTRVSPWRDDTRHFWWIWCWKFCLPYSDCRNSLSPKWSELLQIHRAVRSNSYKSTLPDTSHSAHPCRGIG